MTTNIDISSLDDVTKEKIAQFQRRLNVELSAGMVDEVVKIVRFSDNLADQLGVDKNEFFKKYFWS
jgi:hypothetical protein